MKGSQYPCALKWVANTQSLTGDGKSFDAELVLGLTKKLRRHSATLTPSLALNKAEFPLPESEHQNRP